MTISESRVICGKPRRAYSVECARTEQRGKHDYVLEAFDDGMRNFGGDEMMQTTGAVMKHFFLWFIMVLLLSSCTSHVAVKDPNNLSTAEIIAVLQQEDIKSISTSHAQDIEIHLKDGTNLAGKYRSEDAPPEFKDDILNVSQAIKKKRIKKWETMCE